MPFDLTVGSPELCLLEVRSTSFDIFRSKMPEMLFRGRRAKERRDLRSPSNRGYHLGEGPITPGTGKGNTLLNYAVAPSTHSSL